MAEDSKLFAQPPVRFHIVKSATLQDEEIRDISRSLIENGAEPSTPSLSQQDEVFSLENVTHIIARTIDFPNYDAATETLLDKAVVKPEWISASIMKKKQANPRQYSPDPRMFFSGMIICCADLPEGDQDAIIGYVLAVGGLYTTSVTKQVTHIIALTTESQKCQAALTRNLNIKIVLPHWIDDCLKIRARIDEAPYSLPDPEILRRGNNRRIPDQDRRDLKTFTEPHPTHLPTPLSSFGSEPPQVTVFKAKTVMLSEDLGIGSRLRGTLEDLITAAGGSLTGSAHKADFFFCRYRESLDYRIASRARKEVGNLAWLYHLITFNTWTSPMRRLLHYPVSRYGLPGFKNFRISVSNYNGEARLYLENLARAAGSEFTKTMKDDNTHLITAHPESEKCTAAKEWNINIVNHLWLEQSYARWQVQTISDPQYTFWPQRTNLGEVVGQTDIDKRAIEQYFFPPGSDEEVNGQIEPDSKPAKTHLPPSEKTARPPSAQSIGHGVPLRPLGSDRSTPKASQANRRHTDGDKAQTPANARAAFLGKENETPSTGSRSAKAKAAAKLHDLAPDIALYEKESKRVGGVIHGGRRKSDEDRVESGPRKRSMSIDGQSVESADQGVKAAKRPKKSNGLPTPAMRLLLSGYKRWVGQPTKRKESDEMTQLRELGILIVENPKTCTHLASPKILRTQKFICAVSHAPIILNAKYVDDCLNQNTRLDPAKYILRDKEYEESSGYTMAEALSRAETNKGQLLKDFSLFCTEAIHGGFDTYKAIAEVNGGTCLLYRGRAGSTQIKPAHSEGPADGSDDVYLFTGTTPDEARLWPKFRQMVESNGKTPKILRHDWLLHMALSQRVIPSDPYMVTDEDVGTAGP